MATISLSRRPIRDDAERKNELTCRMSPVPSAHPEPAFREQRLQGKWLRPGSVSRAQRK
jgi:hypothetical protein